MDERHVQLAKSDGFYFHKRGFTTEALRSRRKLMSGIVITNEVRDLVSACPPPTLRRTIWRCRREQIPHFVRDDKQPPCPPCLRGKSLSTPWSRTTNLRPSVPPGRRRCHDRHDHSPSTQDPSQTHSETGRDCAPAPRRPWDASPPPPSMRKSRQEPRSATPPEIPAGSRDDSSDSTRFDFSHHSATRRSVGRKPCSGEVVMPYWFKL